MCTQSTASRTTAQCGTPRPLSAPCRSDAPRRAGPRSPLLTFCHTPCILPPTVSKPFRSHGGESHNQGAGPGQRRVGRYRLARAERLCHVVPRRRERIHRASPASSKLHARAAAQPRHRAAASSACSSRRRGHPDCGIRSSRVLGGSSSASAPRGSDLLLFASERPGGNGYGPASYLKRARHHNVDGCALIGLDPDDARCRRRRARSIPCVGIDMDLEGPPSRS